MEHITPNDFEQLQTLVSEMHTALIGSRIAQDGGMVKRLDKVEARQDKTDKIAAKLAWHFKLLWGAAGGILMAMYSLFIKK